MLSAARRSEDPDAWQVALNDAVGQLDVEISSLRSIIADVRPAALDELGTGAALEALVARIQSRGVEIELDVDLDFESGRAAERHEAELETAVYRIVQEALNNAVKHAGVEAVTVSVREHEGQVAVEVKDRGRGFDLAAESPGFGLVGMRERVEALGGTLEVDSAPGAGTTLSARIPARRRGAPVSERAAG